MIFNKNNETKEKTLFISILLVKVALTYYRSENCELRSNEKERVEERGEDTDEVRNDFP